MSSFPVLSNLKLSDDIGVNTFINRCYQTSQTMSFDKFLKTYTFSSNENTQLKNLVSFKMNNYGSIKSIDGTFIWINPLISNSSVTSNELADNINFPVLNGISVNITSKYWLSPNKYWILYYNNNGFFIYYNPIYRPGFLDFITYNGYDIEGNVMPFFREYCDILGGTSLDNLDGSCRVTPLTLPGVLKNFTRRTINVPNSTINPSIPIIDSIKIYKSGNDVSMTIRDLIVEDYNGVNIISSLPITSKTCDFRNQDKPYLYIYLGDFNIKKVVIEGDTALNNLNGVKIQLLNNTDITYETDLTGDKVSYIWDVTTRTLKNLDNPGLKVILLRPFSSDLQFESIKVYDKQNNVVFDSPSKDLFLKYGIKFTDIDYIYIKRKDNNLLTGSKIQIYDDDVMIYKSDIINNFTFNYLRIYPVSNSIKYYGKLNEEIQSSFPSVGRVPYTNCVSGGDVSGCKLFIKGSYWDSVGYNPVSNDIINKNTNNICVTVGQYNTSTGNGSRLYIGSTIFENDRVRCQHFERHVPNAEQIVSKDSFKYLNKYQNDGLSWKLFKYAPSGLNKRINISKQEYGSGAETADGDSAMVCKTLDGVIGNLYGNSTVGFYCKVAQQQPGSGPGIMRTVYNSDGNQFYLLYSS